MSKIMFVCPFWGQSGHVGTFRAERLVKWLVEDGHTVTVVSTAHADSMSDEWFGCLVCVRDPLKIYPAPGTTTVGDDDRRKPNAFRRWFAYFLLNPDLHIVWARTVLRSEAVAKIAKECDFFLASSPPESAFHAASTLADRYNGKFIMDMRDGWLDEPMKPLLRNLGFQKYREGRLEKKFVTRATHITLTSENWKELLVKRYPEIKSKVIVLPNTYPEFAGEAPVNITDGEQLKNGKESYTLVHAGRLSSSRPERNADFLLNEIIHHIDRHKDTFHINFVGNLEQHELNCLGFWRQKFYNNGSDLNHFNQVSRHQALKMLSEADGLLMISNSYASIPAKYFDYSVSGKPVLCYTTKDSIMTDISEKQAQIHVIFDGQSDRNDVVINNFLKAVRNHNRYDSSNLLPEFTEKVVKSSFLSLFKT